MNRLRTPVWRCRRRLLGRIRRITHWEFWPPCVAYIPLLPYLLYLAWRHRSLTLFTCANPGIAAGGFVRECKGRILSMLPNVPAFAVISSSLPASARLDAAKSFLALHECSYPVVLKPDIGERGRAVSIIRDEDKLSFYVQATPADTIIQKYVEGPEFGIFYYRHPAESEGHIFSIAEKRFPEVVDDGTTQSEISSFGTSELFALNASIYRVFAVQALVCRAMAKPFLSLTLVRIAAVQSF